jgi:hypothetical protein
MSSRRIKVEEAKMNEQPWKCGVTAPVACESGRALRLGLGWLVDCRHSLRLRLKMKISMISSI